MKEIAETRRALVEAMEELEIVDCHEHLGPERCRVESPVDVFTLFSHYTRGDLMVAEMSPSDYDSLFDQRIPLERRWALFEPYWEQIRFGSYARAALLAAKRFYDFDDITEDTYQPLSQAIQRANTPGIYERVLQEACNIRTALSNHGNPPTTDFGTPLLTPVVRVFWFCPPFAYYSNMLTKLLDNRLRIRYTKSHLAFHPGGNCAEPVGNLCTARPPQ